MLLAIAPAGMVGGLVNAFLTEEGFVLWRVEDLGGGKRIIRPGFLGNLLVGAVTAVVLAGLYTPLGAVELGGEHKATDPVFHLTVAALAGALLSGVGGARLLTREVDKRLQQATRKKLGATIDNLTKGHS